MDLVAFVLSALPPRPARVLEVGCGAGHLARALDAAGYHVLAIDPEAPEGPIFRRTTLEELEGPEPFDAAVASYSLHHIKSLHTAIDRIADLLAETATTGPDKTQAGNRPTKNTQSNKTEG